MTRPTPGAGSARLLVVEDRESLRRLFERALAQAGYTVVALATERSLLENQ